MSSEWDRDKNIITDKEISDELYRVWEEDMRERREENLRNEQRNY